MCLECLAEACVGGIGPDALQHPFQHGDLVSVIWIGVFSDLRHGHLRTWLLGVSWACGGQTVVLLMELWVQDVPEGGKRRGRPARPPALSVRPRDVEWEESLFDQYWLSDHKVPLRGLDGGNKDQSGIVPVRLSPSRAEQGPGCGWYSGVGTESVRGRGGGLCLYCRTLGGAAGT